MLEIVLAVLALYLLAKVPDFGGLVSDGIVLLIAIALCAFIVIRLCALIGLHGLGCNLLA